MMTGLCVGCIFLFACMASSVVAASYTWQIKSTAYGSSSDQLGSSIAISSYGERYIVGSTLLDNTGSAKVYELQSGLYEVVGDIDSLLSAYLTAGDKLGQAVAINGDGTVVAISAPGKSSNQGTVFVLTYSAAATLKWILVGSPLNGPTTTTAYFGTALSIDSSGTRLAVGAYNANSQTGYVVLYEYSGFTWSPLITATGEASSNLLGYSVAMTVSGSDAVYGWGIPGFSSSSPSVISSCGKVCFYRAATTSMAVSTSSCIVGTRSNGQLGATMVLNTEGTLALVGEVNGGVGYGYAYVYAYDENGNSWNKRTTISSGVEDDKFANSLSMSDDGSVLAIAAWTTGAVYLYEYNVSTGVAALVQSLMPLTSAAKFGHAVRVSRDGSSVVVGAPLDDRVVSSGGSANVYTKYYAPSAAPTLWPTSSPTSGVIINGESYVWTLRGQELEGALAGNLFGYGLSLSSTGDTVAVGAPLKTNGKGSAYVYDYNSTLHDWQLFASELPGQDDSEQCGYAVSLTSFADKVFVGCPFSSSGTGRVFIRVRVGQTWATQYASDIIGATTGNYFGIDIKSSKTGSFLVVATPYATTCGSASSGTITLYRYIMSAYTTVASAVCLSGTSLAQWSSTFRFRIRMMAASESGFQIAMSAAMSDFNVTRAGVLQVFDYVGGVFVSKGRSFRGYVANEGVGQSVALNADGSVLAFGAAQLSNTGPGYVKVYRYASDWVKWGNTITGSQMGSSFGSAVALTSRGDIIAIASLNYTLSGAVLGLVQVFGLDRSSMTWRQIGNDLYGGDGDTFGLRIALNAAGTVLAISSPEYDGVGKSNCGKVGVYTLQSQPSSQPTRQPSGQPSRQPSRQPSGQPSTQPTSAPSMELVLQYDQKQVVEVGGDIVGWESNLEFGQALDLSGDGTTLLATSLAYNNFSGRAVLYGLRGTGTWATVLTQDGPFGADSYFGYAASLSDDGSFFAIGAPRADVNGKLNAGAVVVYFNDGGTLKTVGDYLYGAVAGDWFGACVALTADGQVVAVAAPYSDASATNGGSVYVYQWNSASWTAKGSALTSGRADVNYPLGSRRHNFMSLSNDGDVVAIGYPFANVAPYTNCGLLRVHKYLTSTNAWPFVTQSAVQSNDNLGGVVALSGNGKVVAVAALGSSYVSVYDMSQSTMKQRGNSFTGSSTDQLGYHLSLNYDGTVLLVSGLSYPTYAGYVGVFVFDRNEQQWRRVQTLTGSASNEYFGSKVCLSRSGLTFAVSAVGYSGGSAGVNGGLVRVYAIVDPPTSLPSSQPSSQPSRRPSRQPTSQPTRQPSSQPSRQPSSQPSRQPSSQPTTQPSRQPSSQPSRQPSGQPTTQPSRQPSRMPSGQPSTQPTSAPSMELVLQYDQKQVVEVGGDIVGWESNLEFGQALDLSGDGTTLLATSLAYNNFSGRAVLYGLRGTGTWATVLTQDGPFGADSYFGYAAALSDDGSFFAIGAPRADVNGKLNAGAVVVYYNDGGTLKTVGDYLYGAVAGDWFGACVALTADGQVVAVAAPYSDASATNGGSVYVYQWNSASWTAKGSALSASGTNLHYPLGSKRHNFLSLSHDGDVVAIGHPFVTIASYTNSGLVRLHQYLSSTNTWSSNPITALQANANFGGVVALSGNGKVVAAAALGSSYVTVYDVSTKVQLGDRFTGSSTDQLGYHLSLNYDGTVLLVSGLSYPTYAGYVGVFVFDRNEQQWRSVATLVGSASNEYFGSKVCLSRSGLTFAVSAVGYSGGSAGVNGGLVRVYAIVDPPTSLPSSQPSSQPSRRPSRQPTSQPTRQPSSQPSRQPSSQPSRQPSSQPTTQPSRQPSSQPFGRPSGQPSGQPTGQPTRQPSSQPSRQPSTQPIAKPSGQPSAQPSARPSGQPSCQPSRQPSGQPSCQPTRQPSRQPSSQPSTQPTEQPASRPSAQPSSQPSTQPTRQPSRQPSSRPTTQPSRQPSAQPVAVPTAGPSAQPSCQPSSCPSRQPSTQPTVLPSSQPSAQPSQQPVARPSSRPSEQPSRQPSAQPTEQPTLQPTEQPSAQPSTQPSMQPSRQPSSVPSAQPSARPSRFPTAQPSGRPSAQPSSRPTSQPSASPTSQPSSRPSRQPSGDPSTMPSGQPSSLPSTTPTGSPTQQPTTQPSSAPSEQPSGAPTADPTTQPSSYPTGSPSGRPSGQPTSAPSVQPSSSPTQVPSTLPSSSPTRQPSSSPSSAPTRQPTRQPSGGPSASPSTAPSTRPSSQPTAAPSTRPTRAPSAQPSIAPSAQPSKRPTAQPTTAPSATPSAQPSAPPTGHPSRSPSSAPSTSPTAQPSSKPSRQPVSRPTSRPTRQPSASPTCAPSSTPSTQPTGAPSSTPSRQPLAVPTGQPSSQPTHAPSQRSRAPSFAPSVAPTRSTAEQQAGVSAVWALQSSAMAVSSSLFHNASNLDACPAMVTGALPASPAVATCKWAPYRRIVLMDAGPASTPPSTVRVVTPGGRAITTSVAVDETWDEDTAPSSSTVCYGARCLLTVVYPAQRPSPAASFDFGRPLRLRDDANDVVVSDRLVGGGAWFNGSIGPHSLCNVANDCVSFHRPTTVGATTIDRRPLAVHLRRFGYAVRHIDVRSSEEVVLHATVALLNDTVPKWSYAWSAYDAFNRSVAIGGPEAGNAALFSVQSNVLTVGDQVRVEVALLAADTTAAVLSVASVTLRCVPHALRVVPAASQSDRRVYLSPSANAQAVDLTVVDDSGYAAVPPPLAFNVSWACGTAVQTEAHVFAPCPADLSASLAANATRRVTATRSQSVYQLRLLLQWTGPASSPGSVLLPVRFTVSEAAGGASAAAAAARASSLVLYLHAVDDGGASAASAPAAAVTVDTASLWSHMRVASAAELAARSSVWSAASRLPNETLRCSWAMIYPPPSDGSPSVVLRSLVLRPASSMSLSLSTTALAAAATAAAAAGSSSNLWVFRLRCAGTTTAASQTDVDVYLNTPPYGGSLAVSPATGVALSTLFAMEAPGWKDDTAEDYPLQFFFQFGTTTRKTTVPGHVLEPFVEHVLLPMPSTAAGGATRTVPLPGRPALQVVVQDSYGATAIASAGANVTLTAAANTTNPASPAYWQHLASLLKGTTTTSVSAAAGGVHGAVDAGSLYNAQQRLVAVLASVSDALASLSPSPLETATAQSVLSQYRNFSLTVLAPALNATRSHRNASQTATVSLRNEVAMAAYVDVSHSWLDAFSRLQEQRTGVLSTVLLSLQQLPLPTPSNGSVNANTAAVHEAVQSVQSAVDAMLPNMVQLLLAQTSANGNGLIGDTASTSSPVLLQTMSVLADLVKVTIAVVSLPASRSNATANGDAVTTVISRPGSASRNDSFGNVVTVAPPTVTVVADAGVVGLVVSVVEVAPGLVASNGFVTVNTSTQNLLDERAKALLASLEKPRLVSDVVTVQVVTASANGSAATALLPKFALNLSLATSSDSRVPGAFPTATSVAWLRHNCSVGVAERVSQFCAESKVWLNLTCSGLAAARVHRQCPVPRTVCSVLDLSSNRVVSDDYCAATVVGGTVQCKCGYGATDGNVTSSLLALRGKVTVAAFSSFAAGDLDSTVSVVAVGLSGNVADQSATILATFSAVWAVGLLLMLLQYVSWSRRAAKKPSKVAAVPTVPAASVASVASVASGGAASAWAKTPIAATPAVAVAPPTVEEVRQSLLVQYLAQALPPIFAPGRSWLQRTWRTVVHQHPHLRVVAASVFGESPAAEAAAAAAASRRSPHDDDGFARSTRQKQLVLDILQLLTALTVSCFVLAVLYDLQYPVDDGYCASQAVDRDTCEFRKTLLDPWQSRCRWTPPPATVSAGVVTETLSGTVVRRVSIDDSGDAATATGSCGLNGDDASVVAFVFSFVIAAVFSSLFDLALTFVFGLFWDDAGSAASSGPSGVTAAKGRRRWWLRWPSAAVGDGATAAETAGDELRVATDVSRSLRRARAAWAASVPRLRGVSTDTVPKDDAADADAVALAVAVRSPETVEASAPSPRWRSAVLAASEVSIGVTMAQRLVAQVAGASAARTHPRRAGLDRHCATTVLRAIERSQHNAHASSTERRGATRSKRSVSWRVWVASALVAMLNGGGLYFILTKAVVRGYSWQVAYLNVCGWEVATDVLVLSVLEILCLDVWLPLCVQAHVTVALDTVARLSGQGDDAGEEEGVEGAPLWAQLWALRPAVAETSLSRTVLHAMASQRSLPPPSSPPSAAPLLSVGALQLLRWYAAMPSELAQKTVRFGGTLLVGWLVYVYYVAFVPHLSPTSQTLVLVSVFGLLPLCAALVWHLRSSGWIAWWPIADPMKAHRQRLNALLSLPVTSPYRGPGAVPTPPVPMPSLLPPAASVDAVRSPPEANLSSSGRLHSFVPVEAASVGSSASIAWSLSSSFDSLSMRLPSPTRSLELGLRPGPGPGPGPRLESSDGANGDGSRDTGHLSLSSSSSFSSLSTRSSRSGSADSNALSAWFASAESPSPSSSPSLASLPTSDPLSSVSFETL